MKELEGKEVYLRPTGNNVRHFRHDKYVKATILKVARVFVTFKLEGSWHEDRYRFKGRSLNGECNSGYIVYADEKELKDYYEACAIAKQITDKYRYSSDYEKLDVIKLRQISEILGVQQ